MQRYSLMDLLAESRDGGCHNPCEITCHRRRRNLLHDERNELDEVRDRRGLEKYVR